MAKEEKGSESKAVVFVAVIAACAIAVYVYAAFHFKWGISGNPSSWGPFGDYVGGIINPAIAIAALYVLVKVSRYQKAEFNATRTHLESEAKKNEIYRVISLMDKKLESMLSLEVMHPHSHVLREDMILGPLSNLLVPGWKVREGFRVTLGSGLKIPLDAYLPLVQQNIQRLKKYLKDYESVTGETNTAVNNCFEDLYAPVETACIEIVGNLTKLAKEADERKYAAAKAAQEADTSGD